MIEYDKCKKALNHLKLQFENYKTLPAETKEIMKEAVSESVIQRFEVCYDCTWKVLKRYLFENLGLPEVPNSPKPIFRIAGENNLFSSSSFVNRWIQYADIRVDTSHDYNGEKAKKALEIMPNFINDAIKLYKTMSKEEYF